MVFKNRLDELTEWVLNQQPAEPSREVRMIDGEWYISSKALALMLGISHDEVLRVIEKNRSQLAALSGPK
jgi:hypothetical protein